MTNAKVTLRNYLECTDRILSRTSTGTVNTNVSIRKKRPLLEGEKLIEQVKRNRDLIARFIEWKGVLNDPSEDECFYALITLANMTGFRLLPEGLLRVWKFPVAVNERPVAPEHVADELAKLGASIPLIGTRAGDEEKLSSIAGVEWELGIGPLHPFYDGCGRISRYYSALLSKWFKTPVVQHTSRENYYSAGREGKERFVYYYLSLRRLTVCG
jgi:hypothetical protein